MATRSSIYKLRQMALHCIARPPHSSSTSENSSEIRSPIPEQANRIFQLGARNLQYDNLIHFNGSLRGFLCHVHFSIPWGAPVYILKTLASRGDWDIAMESEWARIEELYQHRPEFIEDDTDIHLIVRGLTLRAWFARETFLKSRTAVVPVPGSRSPPIPTPPIIPIIQERHQKFLSQKHSSMSSQNSVGSQHQQQQNWQYYKSMAFGNRNLDDNCMPP